MGTFLRKPQIYLKYEHIYSVCLVFFRLDKEFQLNLHILVQSVHAPLCKIL